MCDKVVCQRWCVTKLCVKDDVSKSKMVCVTKCPTASPVPQVPRLPRKWKVNVTLSATPATQNEGRCHQAPRLPQKRRWMSRSATPAMPSGAAPRATQRAQARHQSQPSAISGTPATRSEGGCATPAPQSTAASQATNPGPSAPPSTISATKRRWMSPSAMRPATQSTAASPATKRAQARPSVDKRDTRASPVP